MQRIFALLAVAIASVGVAFAQAPAAPKKDATKETTTAKPTTPAATPAAAPSTPAAAPSTPPKDMKPAPTKEPGKDAKAPAKELVDVNSASEKELDALKGIGAARAKAIVKNRPYKGKDEIVKKAGIPQKVYDEIKDQIIAKQK
jgi:competence protein ComEA